MQAETTSIWDGRRRYHNNMNSVIHTLGYIVDHVRPASVAAAADASIAVRDSCAELCKHAQGEAVEHPEYSIKP